jgi:hypothetical protein
MAFIWQLRGGDGDLISQASLMKILKASRKQKDEDIAFQNMTPVTTHKIRQNFF